MGNMKSRARQSINLEVPGAGDPTESIPDGHGVGEEVQGASLVHLRKAMQQPDSWIITPRHIRREYDKDWGF